MYIKIKDGQIEKYPYSYGQLKADNPQTSFPTELNDALLAEWGMLRVAEVYQPEITYKQNVTEGTPQIVGDQWVQVWNVTDKPADEVAALTTQLRADAYRNEADPLFFKAQRGEATMEQWLAKVAEIKQRYPE